MADEKEKEAAAADKARHDEEAKRDAMMDAIMDSFKRMDSRLDAFEKERKDAKRHDAARKDKFGKRKDGESYKDWGKRHDEDMRSMCDALRKDSEESEEDCMDAARRARKDAEEDEKREDKDFDKWAKEEEKEPEHAEDKAKRDAEEKAKKDAEEDEEAKKIEAEEDRKDSTVKENAELRLRIKSLEDAMKSVKRETPREDVDALANVQARADSVAAMFGDRAPPPIPGETPLDYRRRMASRFKRHSQRFKDTRFDSLDAETLGVVEDVVYHDAVSNARATGEAMVGALVPFVERDMAGRQITRFHGDVGAFLAPFVPQEAQRVKVIRPQRGI